jgi:hypothetical protein
MKIRSLVSFLCICIHATTAFAAISLTVNGKSYDTLEVKVGQAVQIEIRSDTALPYSAYAGFDTGIAKLGTLSNPAFLAAAGNLASIAAVTAPPLDGYYMNAAGTSPAPSAGLHFSFTYTASTIGQTVLKLYDSVMAMQDSINITVQSAQLGTGFTYQGRLLDNNTAANGLYDLVFTLFDAPSQGTGIGTAIALGDVDVIDGYFNVSLDFGNVFTSNAVWLDIAVRPGASTDPAAYVTLTPRQRLTPAPFAVYAVNVAGAGTITGVTAGTGLSGGGASGNVTLRVAAPFSLEDAGVEFPTISAIAARETGRAIYGLAADSGAYINFGGYLEAAGQRGRGVYGYASYTGAAVNYGGYFRAAAQQAQAVYGYASSTAVDTNYGGYFRAGGAYGRGVYGYAANTGDYTNYGGYFQAAGASGIGAYGYATGVAGYGVYGSASNTGTTPNYGGYFHAAGVNGYGVFGASSGSSGYGVYGTCGGDSGIGVYGLADNDQGGYNYGGYFEASGYQGTGVYGAALNTGGAFNYGGFFQAYAPDGMGIYACAENSTGNANIGGYFRAKGVQGRAVYGTADSNNASAANFGGYFEASGPQGRGVYGYAYNSGTNTNYGGYFEAASANGRGVYGLGSNSTSDYNYGGYFEARGYAGRAVYGVATNTSGTYNYGGYFKASGVTGQGVYGYADSTSANINYGGYFEAAGLYARGVYGCGSSSSDTAANFGGFFEAFGKYGYGVKSRATGTDAKAVYGVAENTGSVTNYGGNFEARGATGRGVYGYASNNGNFTNYGGYFEASGATGIGVRGVAARTGGIGVEGVAGQIAGDNSIGVKGVGGGYDFYADGPGVNYGATSSIRWKKDIEIIDEPLNKIMQIRGVYFNWDQAHGGKHDVGMIAEEVGKVLPEIVVYEENGVDADGMDYGKTTPLLVEAVKALKTQLDEVRKENDELRRRLAIVEAATAKNEEPANEN